MSVTRKATGHIFDKCKHCRYREAEKCTYKNANKSVVWYRQNKKLTCPKEEDGIIDPRLIVAFDRYRRGEFF